MHHSSSSHSRHSASQQTIYQTSTLNAKRFACRRFINPHSGRNIPEYFKSKTTVVCTILQFNAAVIFHRHVFKSAARLLVQIVQQINDSTAGTGCLMGETAPSCQSRQRKPQQCTLLPRQCCPRSLAASWLSGMLQKTPAWREVKPSIFLCLYLHS